MKLIAWTFYLFLSYCLKVYFWERVGGGVDRGRSVVIISTIKSS